MDESLSKPLCFVSSVSFVHPSVMRSCPNVRIHKSDSAIASNSSVLSAHSSFLKTVMLSVGLKEDTDEFTVILDTTFPDDFLRYVDEFVHDGQITLKDHEFPRSIRDDFFALGIVLPDDFWGPAGLPNVTEKDSEIGPFEPKVDIRVKTESGYSDVTREHLEELMAATQNELEAISELVDEAVESKRGKKRKASTSDESDDVSSTEEWNQVQCDHCDKWFESDRDLRRHKARQHATKKRFECAVCGAMYNDRESFHNHKTKHELTGERVVSKRTTPGQCCIPCGVIFPTRVELKEHRKEMHRDRVLQCPLCPKSYQGLYMKNYEEHVESHRKKWSCVSCGQEFTQELSMETHMKNMGPFHDNVCHEPDCSAVFVDWNEHRLHIDRDHGGRFLSKCGKCGRVFENAAQMRSHVRLEHPTEGDFVCEVCGKSCKNKSSLQCHMETHNAEKKPFVCDICGKVIGVSPSGLTQHKKDVHGDAITCEYCGKKSIGKKKHKNHILWNHTPKEQWPFKCDTCPKTFLFRHALLAHAKIHANLREYKCQICGAGFNDLSNRNQHEKKTHKLPFPSSTKKA